MNNKSTSNQNNQLSFLALFSLIFGSMMGSGVFDIPMNVANRASLPAVLICWVITAIGMLALGFAFSYISRKMPDIKSGIYGYAKYGFGDYVGFNVAWGYWLNALLGNAGYLIYIFATLSNFALFKFLGLGTNIYSLIGESFLIWIIFALIVSGIKQATLLNTIISTLKILSLFAIIVIFIYGFNYIKFKNNLHINYEFGDLFTQTKSTMLVTVWDFLGIEAACIYAINARNMNDVAKSTMWGVIAVLLIDTAISVLPFGILEGHKISVLHTPSAASVMSYLVNGNITNIIRITILISVIGALLSWMLLATQIIFVSAKDNTFPKYFAILNEKNVPSKSLLLSAITLQLFVIIAYFTDSVYILLIQFATSLILIPYLITAIFAVIVMFKHGKIILFDLFKGLLAIIYGVWLIYAGGLKYLLFSTLLYSLGIVFYYYAKRENGQSLFMGAFEKMLFILLTGISLILIINLKYKFF